MTLRFEHYELLQAEDGRPVELGRGAMGITYKAFDVDLHCAVTLKVISERYLCLLYTSPSPRDLSTSRMPSSA